MRIQGCMLCITKLTMATDPLFANTLLFVLIFGSIALFAVGWIALWIYFVWQAHRREMRNDYTLSRGVLHRLADSHKRNGTWVGSEAEYNTQRQPEETEPESTESDTSTDRR